MDVVGGGAVAQIEISWRESRIFELGTDDGEITLSCCKSEHGNLENIWTVVGVTSIKDRPKQMRNNCSDVSMANGKTVALSAHTADEKKHWLKAITEE